MAERLRWKFQRDEARANAKRAKRGLPPIGTPVPQPRRLLPKRKRRKAAVKPGHVIDLLEGAELILPADGDLARATLVLAPRFSAAGLYALADGPLFRSATKRRPP